MRRQFIMLLLTVVGCATIASAADPWEQQFTQPPSWSRPWVYWFPLSGNLTKEGITADLEAMQRVGIGGVLYMEVEQGTPAGPADFAGPLWRELFQHACREADRLGLELNMNNDAGWCGSGGPWITPEQSMQKVVWTETVLEGPRTFDGVVAQPASLFNFYRDIAVLAMPLPEGDAKIASIAGKASFVTQHFPPQRAEFASLPQEEVIAREGIRDISERMNAEGNLAWDVPEGKWLVLRVGHTTTGKDNHPAPEPGRGLECDKFNPAAAESHFEALVGKLIADNPSLVGDGKVFVSTHIDSWEVGSQNWTPNMREEFRRRRGYDLWPFLPVFTGRVVGSLELSERFLWDLRQTVSDLIVENYAGKFRQLANQHGLRLSIEAYGEPADDMTYAGQADEPMSEFWSWAKYSAAESCTEMASAAHTYGKRILGAEAFTATDAEKWLGHPGNIKDLGDWAFCEGVNRFVFHRYAAQPWLDRAPGISMGPWGLHYERTQTWWEQSQAWHEYLARCQYMLQQGLFVADLCYLQPEGAPRQFLPPPGTSIAPFVRGGYNFDGCTSEVVLTRMSVVDGRIVLPDGMSYRALVLPQVETMTPKLLSKIKELIEAGATVFTPTKPVKAPGLSDYPNCDQQVQQLAQEIWGTDTPPAEITTRSVGQGHVVWGGELSPQPTAEERSIPQLRGAQWIWQKKGNPAAAADVGMCYFRRIVQLEPNDLIESAQLLMTADNSFECWVNGRRVGEGNNFTQATLMDIQPVLKNGPNVIAVAASNGAEYPNPAGVLGRLDLRLKDGRSVSIPTDESWDAAEKVAADWRTATVVSGWGPAMELGPCGMAPWGDPEYMPALHDVYPHAASIYRYLADRGLPPDFQADHILRHIHRRVDDAEVFFVANGTNQSFEATCSFRVTGKQPELWHPETGRVVDLPYFQEQDGVTNIPLRFEPTEAVFVVFRRPVQKTIQLLTIQRNGQELTRIEPVRAIPNATGIKGSFTMAAWVNPAADTLLPRESSEGITAYAPLRNDVIFPPPGHEVWGPLQAGAGLAVGRNGVCVHEHGSDHFPSVLTYPATIKDWTHVAVVYHDGTPSLYLNGKKVRTGLKSGCVVHPGLRVPHNRSVVPFQGQIAGLQQFDHALEDAQLASLARQRPDPVSSHGELIVDLVQREIWQPGSYRFQTADRQTREVKVSQLPTAVELTGPWDVQFDPRWGGPEQVTFEQLTDWTRRPEDAVRYYSGTAVYRKSFQLDQSLVDAIVARPAGAAPGRRLYLDLGEVAVIGEVTLNGHYLGTLWTMPMRVDISEAIVAGDNHLEVKVINLWINRQIGDQQLPEDSDRNAGGTLKSWPAWLLQGQPSPTGRLSFTSWRLWKKDDPLQPSGLLGPVTLQTAATYGW